MPIVALSHILNLSLLPDCYFIFVILGRRRFFQKWVVARLPFVPPSLCRASRSHIFPDESSSYEVTAILLMFILALHFAFESRFGIWPLLHNMHCFLLSTFVSYHFVLVLKPKFLNLLLGHIIGWVIVIVIGPSFESVLGLENDWLSSGVKLGERVWNDRPFIFFKICLTALRLCCNICLSWKDGLRNLTTESSIWSAPLSQDLIA